MVNPDDLLIFKLREKAKPLPGAAAQAAPAQAARPVGAAVGSVAPNQEVVPPTPQKIEERVQEKVVPETQYGRIPEGQGQVSFPESARSEAARKEGTNTSAYIAGVLFMASAAIFG